MRISVIARLFLIAPFLPILNAQSAGTGYTDYNLQIRDPSGQDVVYETASTDTSDGSANLPPPDVYLNASLSVGEVDILVESLSAKINLDAQVLNLLQFSAGVNLNIGQVNLRIENVSARVELEVRLKNVVSMINDTLNSIDLNPSLAALGNTVSNVTSAVTSVTSNTKRGVDFMLQQGILYSLNDYSGNTHTNRVLEQDGDVVDESLDNGGEVTARKIVGTYQSLMTAIGEPKMGVIVNGQATMEQLYTYSPQHLGSFGLEVVCHVFTNSLSQVVATRVVAEIEGGGSSTISDDLK